MKDDLVANWAHFNLREQSELLQILLLYFAHTSQKFGMSKVTKRIWQLAHDHKFGGAKGDGGSAASTPELASSIGQLESLLIVSR